MRETLAKVRLQLECVNACHERPMFTVVSVCRLYAS